MFLNDDLGIVKFFNWEKFIFKLILFFWLFLIFWINLGFVIKIEFKLIKLEYLRVFKYFWGVLIFFDEIIGRMFLNLL